MSYPVPKVERSRVDNTKIELEQSFLFSAEAREGALIKAMSDILYQRLGQTSFLSWWFSLDGSATAFAFHAIVCPNETTRPTHTHTHTHTLGRSQTTQCA